MRCASPKAKIDGLLHNVVEDTSVTFEELEAEGFDAEILAALRLLTHASEVSYEDYIQQVKTHPIATEAKLADLEDNMDIRRLETVDEKAITRFRKYLAAYRDLSGV